MTYLDVSPMITALRASPETFEFTGGSLHHIPSGHRFHFDRAGAARIDARCDCSFLAVSKEQEPALFEAFRDWRVSYWGPFEINRQFAAHFMPASGWRRLLIGLTARLHRALLRQAHDAHMGQGIAVPAE